MNLSFKYIQNSSTLLVEGLPDYSNNQDNEVLGIISSWKLVLVGFPQLEGKREHLEALMSAVISYSRNCVSGIRRSIGLKSIVSIIPSGDQHKMILTSSKEAIAPLEIFLDDAELADLVSCLDQLRTDSKVKISWQLEKDRPFSRKDFPRRTTSTIKLIPFFLGSIVFFLSTILLTLIPFESNLSNPDTTPSTQLLPKKSKR